MWKLFGFLIRKGPMRKFFISYLVILLLPIAIGAYAYWETVSVVEEDAKLASLSNLETNKEIMDRRLSEIEQLVSRLSVDASISHFLNVKDPLTDYDYAQLANIKKELQAYNTNQFMVDFFVYFKHSQTIVTSKAGVYHGEADYKQFVQYGNFDFQQWEDFVTRHSKTFFPPEVLQFEGRKLRAVAYVSTMSLGRPDEPDGGIVVYIDHAQFTTFLNNAISGNGGSAFILNGDGQVMASTQAEVSLPARLMDKPQSGSFHDTVDGQSVIVSYVTSLYNNWKYVSITPSDTVLAKAINIKRMIWLITSITLLVGIAIAVYLSYRQSKPIRELLQTFIDIANRKDVPVDNDIDFMKGTLYELLHNNQQLEQLMKQQIPNMRKSFIDKLLRGDLRSVEEAEAFAEQAGMDIKASHYMVFMIKIPGSDGFIDEATLTEMNLRRFIIINILDDIFHEPYWVQEISEDVLAVLFCSSSRDVESLQSDLQEQLDRLLNLMRTKFAVNVTAGVSRPYVQLIHSWKAYQEARQAMERANEQEMVWSEQRDPADKYHYPMEVESKLTNTVKAGETGELSDVLDYIYKENMESRILSAPVLRSLMLELKGTILKIAGQLQERIGDIPNNLLNELESAESKSFNDYYLAFTGILMTLCEQARQFKNNRNNKMLQQMLQYIEREFINPDLSLSLLSENTGLSESYISYFFKQYLQQNFSTYLENMRLDKACELLEKTDLSIQEITNRVGYNNDRTFRRAFKRVKGVQPTTYRDSFG
jgi:two-component system response regulator YesN